jgi:hypothetical protein
MSGARMSGVNDCAVCGQTLWSEPTVMAMDLGVRDGFVFVHPRWCRPATQGRSTPGAYGIHLAHGVESVHGYASSLPMR